MDKFYRPRLLAKPHRKRKAQATPARSVCLSREVIVGILVTTILCLAIILPQDYVVGYAYVVPILYANYRLDSRWSKWVTVIAVCLTLLDFFDGQYLVSLDSISPVLLFNSILTSVALIVTHILGIRVRSYSELAANCQAEIALQAGLASLRSDFGSTLVHDLQTPLIGAVETIYALKHGDFGAITTEQERALKIMSRAHQGSLHQLDTLLEVCQQDYHGLYLNYQPNNLETIANNAIETLTDFAYHRQVQIEWLNESATTEIECDLARIDRVFSNLLLNAIEQSPRHSSIVVQMSDTVTHYQVQVIDKGRGIKSADLPYIFIKHYQGSIGRRSKGAGLGLYLVKQIVETHGGTIWVKLGIEKGVAFVFTLPKKADAV